MHKARTSPAVLSLSFSPAQGLAQRLCRALSCGAKLSHHAQQHIHSYRPGHAEAGFSWDCREDRSTLDPVSGEDSAVRELHTRYADSDAVQALHLSGKLESILGLGAVVQLVKEAGRPLVDQAHPVCGHLHSPSSEEQPQAISLHCQTGSNTTER